MKIILKDLTEYELLSNSTTTEFIVMFSSIDEFVAAYKKMTDDNLSEFTIGETALQNRFLTETKTYKMSDSIEAHFVIIPTETEILMKEMRARVQESEDKANAYDVLVSGQ